MSARLALVFVFLAALSGAALAQQPDALVKASTLFADAQSQYLAKNFDGAAEGFKQAYEARPQPQFLYNAAAAYHMKGKKTGDVGAYELAVQYYQKYLTSEPTAEDKPAVEKSIEILGKEIARLKAAAEAAAVAAAAADPAAPPPPPPDLTTPSAEVAALGDVVTRSLVVIETEPQGANIYLDDKKNGVFAQTPWSGSLDGQHKILIEKRGHKSKDAVIAPDPNRLVVLQVVLSEEDYLGWIEIKANIPGALVYSDDKAAGPIGKTPYSGNFKPGKHKIWIAADGYDEYAEEIEIVAGKTHEVAANLRGAPVGYLNIRGANLDRAKVKVDGAVVCERGPCRTPVREGKRTIVVSRSGFKPYRARLELQAKTELTVTPNLVKRPGRTDAVVAYIFTAILAGGATGAYIYANGLKVDDSLYDKRDYVKYGAYGGWGLAGVVGLSAIYYTFRDKGPPSTGTVDVKALALTPTVGSDFAGLSVGGGF
ncbi:MAG: PEGA domain-containing protein [Myxococcales bacterium]|nr:PEGA domain-containing protein [Myxococcales bacterium]